MQDSLDDNIDRLTSMISKLTAQDDNPNKHLKSKIYKANGEDKQEISRIKIIMVREITKIDIDQIVEIEGHNI